MDAVRGYLELGLLDEAHEEIEQLPPSEKASVQVLRLRATIYSALGTWSLLREVAGFLVGTVPEDGQHWLWLAQAARKTAGLAEAANILQRAVRSHPDDAAILYSLACYNAQSGKIQEAKERLMEAIDLDPGMRLRALDDPELEPVW